jgi:DNA polymerase III subunit epsilon
MQAFERVGVAWPAPPVLCTVALARRLHPLARQRRLRPLAESLGIDVEVSHRALADAETSARASPGRRRRSCAPSRGRPPRQPPRATPGGV